MKADKLILTVRRTEDRPLYILENIVQLNSKNMKRLSLKEGDRVVLINRIKCGNQETDLTIDALVYKPSDELDDESIRIDQALRNAIGIPTRLTGKEKVEVRKAKFKRRSLLERLLPSQEAIVRVQYTTPKYMEKPVCCVEREVLKIIGVREEGFCELINSEGKSIRLRVLMLSEKELIQRKKRLKEKPNALPHAYLVLKLMEIVETDIPWIFIDMQARRTLKVNTGNPVRIRRSLRHIISENILATGFLILIALIGGIILTPFPWNIISPFVAFIAYMILTLYKIRKEQLP